MIKTMLGRSASVLDGSGRSRQPDTRAAVVKTTTPATRRRRFKILVMGSRPERTPPTPENFQSPVTAQRLTVVR